MNLRVRLTAAPLKINTSVPKPRLNRQGLPVNRGTVFAANLL
jgi:hypothetical protein